MGRIQIGGIALIACLALTAASSVSAGVLIRNEEGRPSNVLQTYRELSGVPSTVNSTWNRFVDAFAKERALIAVPAVKPKDLKDTPDLGDGFLPGFAKERGLKRKLKVVSGYRIGLDKAFRWIQTLPPSSQSALRPSFSAFAREAGAIEGILIAQLGQDLTRGGRGLGITVGFIQQSGYTEEVAQAGFQGLLKGLKKTLVGLANSGEIDESARKQQARQLQLMERLLRGE